MIITATEFKSDVGKYLILTSKEEIAIDEEVPAKPWGYKKRFAWFNGDIRCYRCYEGLLRLKQMANLAQPIE